MSLSSSKSSSYYDTNYESVRSKSQHHVTGLLAKVEVPRLTRYTNKITPTPAIIGRDVKALAEAATSTKLLQPHHGTRHPHSAKIIGRAGIERLGRFQHAVIVYQVEIVDAQSRTTTHEITYDRILNHVTLHELERFENAQFEKELDFKEPSSTLYPKRRGRPPKGSLTGVGISSDEESQSVEHSSVAEDTLAIGVRIPTSRKRSRSPSPVRPRGRPRKTVISRSPSISASSLRPSRRHQLGYEHISLPQVNRRARKPPSRKLSSEAGSDLGDISAPLVAAASSVADAGSDQLILFDQLSEASEDSKHEEPNRLTQVTQFPVFVDMAGSKSSSQLVRAAEQVSDEQLEEMHVKFQAKKPQRGRPSKQPQQAIESSEDSDLGAIRQQFQARRRGRPRKDTQAATKINLNEPSSTEDELSSLHQRYKATSKNVDASLLTSDKSKLDKRVKPGPTQRSGYRAPSFTHQPAATFDEHTSISSSSSRDSSASNERTLLSHKPGAAAQHTIQISSHASSDPPSAVASPRFRNVDPIPTPTPKTGTSSKTVKPRRTRSENTNQTSDTESDTNPQNESSESHDDVDDKHIIDFEIPDISSSQSYIATKSTSSSDADSEAQTLRPRKISRTQRAPVVSSQTTENETYREPLLQSRPRKASSIVNKSNPKPQPTASPNSQLSRRPKIAVEHQAPVSRARGQNPPPTSKTDTQSTSPSPSSSSDEQSISPRRQNRTLLALAAQIKHDRSSSESQRRASTQSGNSFNSKLQQQQKQQQQPSIPAPKPSRPSVQSTVPQSRPPKTRPRSPTPPPPPTQPRNIATTKAKTETQKERRVSMTPLFPAAAGGASPGRRAFSTREFTGE